MREILRSIQKPSRYAAIEDGVIKKDPAKVRLHIALAFPDTYEVGMSYLGQKILYAIANNNPAWWAERVMAPEKDACEVLALQNLPLCSLESDTPLHRLHAICFSITHELCYTDVLHMLDLGGIPLKSADRSPALDVCPIVMAGGGALLGAEPLMAFLDLAVLGDGEEIFPEILTLLEKARDQKWSRRTFLEHAAAIPGVYVPSFFSHDQNGIITAHVPEHKPARRIVADLDSALYPVRQVLPIGAVHNRLSLEIARGCTRGCRFCHAGMVYRPARERNLQNLESCLTESLKETGFEEVSFLALSAGDYSALKTLYLNLYEKCQSEQITLSLPSLRAGSVDGEIMAKMASLRRSGCTIAPEAGSQRLRDVINKGVTEADLLDHARLLHQHGWRQVKLYFMIGLPTETDEDLEAIADLCAKVRDTAPKHGLQVTAAVSPFVPKPFTPFQWEAQVCGDELERRLALLRELFKKQKNMTLHWHDPKAALLEGILSRGDRRLCEVVEKAYRKGAVFCAWHEHFSLEPWLEALAECGLEPGLFTGPRNPDTPLPWSHISAGIDPDFLKREREKAFGGVVTSDCRYHACNMCGACDTAKPSLLARPGKEKAPYRNRLVFPQRDQTGASASQEAAPHEPGRPGLTPRLRSKAAVYRVWHRKEGDFAYLSNLELQAMLARYMRRANIPLAFSQGFHPMPLISFGRALPVGLESACEWVGVTLHENIDPDELKSRLAPFLPDKLALLDIFPVQKELKTLQSSREKFLLSFDNEQDAELGGERFANFSAASSWPVTRQVKGGFREEDARPRLAGWTWENKKNISFMADWSGGYLSPLLLATGILDSLSSPAPSGYSLKKIGQYFNGVLPDFIPGQRFD